MRPPNRLTGRLATLVKSLTLVAISFIVWQFYTRGKERMTNHSLNAAFIEYQPASSYDPLKIQFSPEYVFLENIYSTLLETDINGEIVSGLAERFDWVGTELHFKIREGLKTIDGHPITAKDAETSFKRVLLLQGGTHTDLADMVCPGKTLKQLADPCTGMEVRDSGATLVLKLKKKNIALLKTFTSLDLAVIPANSLDPKTLAITDYRNTSGPYFVEHDDPEGKIKLVANPSHYHYSKRIPQAVQLVPAGKNGIRESVELFTQGKVDHIMSCDKAKPEVLIEYANAQKQAVDLHTTSPFNLHMIAFTRKGISRFSEAERFKIGYGLRRIYLKRALHIPGMEEAQQMVPTFGTEMLTEEQLSKIDSARKQVRDEEILTQKILGWNLSIGNLYSEDADLLKKYFPNTRIEIGKSVPAFTDFKKDGIEEPDLMFVTIDMGFEESVGRMSYTTNAGLFYTPGMDVKKWVANYMGTEDKNKRIAMAREIHYETLAHACSIPMVWAPYASIVRKPWRMDFSKIYPSSYLWRITRN